jgi:myo-inositol-1(or 4)-monophosphatase
MKPKLSDIENLAKEAGKILKSGFGHRIQIDQKGIIDLVTEMDRQSEQYLLDSIRSQFPSHKIITEESGVLEGDSDQVWYLDPLDGTVNYAHGVPIFSVSIAYAERGEVVLAGVYDPIKDEFFSAELGAGTWVNGESIQVSEAKDVNTSLLVTGFPYDIRTRSNNNLDLFAKLSLKSRGVRRLGSAAIDLAYVASGRLDGFWEISIHPWDIAAGSLIVKEAGGKVTSFYGEDEFLTPEPSILATNGLIHTELQTLLNE